MQNMTKKRTLVGALILALSFSFFSVNLNFPAAATNQSNPERLAEIIEIINDADGLVPECITKEDIELLVNSEGAEVEATINKMFESATSVDPLVDDSIEQTVFDNGNRGSYKYDCETGIESYVDGSQFNYPAGEEAPTSPSIAPTSYPTDWEEPNPHEYSNTRSTCRILLKVSSLQVEGTGFLISGNAVATAAHVIYDDVYPSWAIVIPALSTNSPSEPYGRTTAKSFEIGGYYKDNKDQDDDWGVITLNTSFNVGGLLTISKAGDSINGWWVRLQGYPGDKMRLTGGNITEVDGRRVRTKATSFSGMSGGPCLDGNDNIIGIIKGRYANGDSRVIKFDDWLYNKLTSY